MALWKRLVGLKQPDPQMYAPEVVDTEGDAVTLTYLGTAGFVISGAERTIVIDPYVSRSGPIGTVTKRLVSDAALVSRYLPKADDVLVGHAHYDHILDAPTLCIQTGARLIGSSATMMVGRAAKVPEVQLVETSGRTDIAAGSWTLRGLPSVHGKVLGRVPLPGDITAPPPWPPRFHELRHGLVLNWLVDTGSLRIVHIDSADFINAEFEGIKADIVCLCAVGRRYRPNYVSDVVRLLSPRWIVPCHWDTMLTPIDAPPDLIPFVDLPGFIREIQDAGAEPLLMPLLGQLGFGS